MHRLTAAVRDDIADCAAAAYPSLSVGAAQRMFKFDSPAELAEYMRVKRVCGAHEGGWGWGALDAPR